VATRFGCALRRQLLKNAGGSTVIGDSHKRISPWIFPRTRQRFDANAAAPSGPNGPGFGFKESHGHPLGRRGNGVATGLAVGRWPLTGWQRKLPIANGSLLKAQFQSFADPSVVIHHGRQRAFWSQPDENRGWPLVILASDRIIQIACSEADNQTGGVVQNAGELNSF